MFIGTSGDGQQSGMLISDTGQIVFDIYDTRIDTTVDAGTGIWHHFTGVFKGGTSTWDNASTDLYINGQLEGSAVPEDSVTFNLTGNGIQFGTSTSSPFRYFNGSISNFKLYDTALTAEEVKTLYDMGRCDEGGHVVNFSKTRVGIGLGDGEAPTSTLDVRGTFQGNSSLRFFVLNGKFPATGSTQDVTDLPSELIARADGIIFMQGISVSSNGDRVNWMRHGSSTHEVDISYDASVPKFLLSGFDASVTITSKEWRIFVVTT